MKIFETITKAEQVLNHLRRRILTGALEPNSKIPPERTLAREYALSRVTVNKITSALVQEGLLERRGPRGTFVVGSNGRSGALQIGFLMRTTNPQEVNPIYEMIFRSFVRASQSHPVLVSFGMMGRWGETLPGGFDARGLDALIVAGGCPAERIEPFRQRRRPVFRIDEVEEAGPRHLVTTDHFEAGRTATAHLLRRGCRAILTLGYPVGGYLGFERRLEGYRRAHAEAGVAVDERRILRPYYSRPEHVVEIFRQLEADGVSFDAVFGLADLLAIWALDALTRLGRRVPEDVAVIGIDGLPAGEWARPKLTTVAQPAEALGRRAFERVWGWLQSGKDAGGAERLAPKLIVRESA